MSSSEMTRSSVDVGLLSEEPGAISKHGIAQQSRQEPLSPILTNTHRSWSFQFK